MATQPDSWHGELEAWRSRREARLRAPDGWLTLVGLHWLRRGELTLGSDPGCDVVLPKGSAPLRLGKLVVSEAEVRFVANPGMNATHSGRAVTSMALASDRAGEPTILQVGNLSFHLIDREGELALRVKDSQSKTRTSFAGLRYFEPDPSWRVDARFEPAEASAKVKLRSSAGTGVEEELAGVVTFTREGVAYALKAFKADPGELFIVFGDATNGKTTYPSGRFLYAAHRLGAPMSLDFNRAYSPPCAFTPYATCPLPPPGNTLPTEVRAGEQYERHH